jgi:hypothetical protein
MTVEELIEKLKEMPPTAMVFMCGGDKDDEDSAEFFDESVDDVDYDLGRVLLKA